MAIVVAKHEECLMSDRGGPFCNTSGGRAFGNPLEKFVIIANNFICKQNSHLGKGVAARWPMVQV
jgi:hypothetical protein